MSATEALVIDVAEPVPAPLPTVAMDQPARFDGALRAAVGLAGALVVFGALMAAKGANPLIAYADMVRSTFTDLTSLGDVVIRATPLILAALAVTVPARAGLVNVGGEGQLLLGGVAAIGVSLAVGGALPGGVTLLVMAVAAAAAGAAWAAIAAGLRHGVGINEAVTTLLLNYLALDVQRFLVFDRWKDPNGSGQPATRPLPIDERLPVIGTSRVHGGIVVALLAVAVIWFVLNRTRFGFRLQILGGNPEAARRAGMRTGLLLTAAMALGGALAGLGGFTQLAGAEFSLRQGFVANFGYVAFLASWLARHKPVHAMGAALAARRARRRR